MFPPLVLPAVTSAPYTLLTLPLHVMQIWMTSQKQKMKGILSLAEKILRMTQMLTWMRCWRMPTGSLAGQHLQDASVPKQARDCTCPGMLRQMKMKMQRGQRTCTMIFGVPLAKSKQARNEVTLLSLTLSTSHSITLLLSTIWHTCL